MGERRTTRGMATMREVAAAANVSPATASRVLGRTRSQLPVSEAASRRVREAAARLGYRVNYHMQAVATGRAHAMGFATASILHREVGSGDGNHYFDNLRRGVEYVTQESGAALISVRPSQGRSALEQGMEFLLERRLDALIVPGSGSLYRSAHLLEPDLTFPVVLVNADDVVVRRPRVVFNVPEAMRLVVAHLREFGHQEVLWFGPQTGLRWSASLRRQLFVETAWETGIRGAACTVERDDQRVSERDHRQQLGREILARAVAAPERRWTAIVAYNDLWAVTACAAVRDAGLVVPRDVSVIGFDNVIADCCVPGLTTIDHRFYEMGRQAGELAARLIEMDDAQRAALLDYEEMVEPLLVVRESTGPAPERAGLD